MSNAELRRPLRSSFAEVSLRARRKASACAFPLPSAKASEKFAKRTVNQSQSETPPMYHAGASPVPTSAWIQSTVVNKLPTSTTNMTGFFAMLRGFSFAKESTNARRYIPAVNPTGFLNCSADEVPRFISSFFV